MSLAGMPFLSLAQRRTGRPLHSGPVVSDSAQTMRCSRLSAVLLVGLLMTGCSAGTPADEACVQHSVDEGVDRAAAEAACERLED